MTNGSSQGLFVVVAIVIFGIFVLISFLLFEDNLKPTLSGIFTDGLEQADNSLDNYDGKNHIGDELTITRGYISNYLRETNTPFSENNIFLQNKDLNIIELTSEEASEQWNYSEKNNTIMVRGAGAFYKNVYSKSLEKYFDEETQNATFTQKITSNIFNLTDTIKFIDRIAIKNNHSEDIVGVYYRSSATSIQLDKEYTFTQTLTNNYSSKVTQETYKFKFIINDNK
ncbi:hypothetical protein MXF01_10325 [Enterococcus casseliflavus]|uniref:hypothetical protein n=1 Tax=Enterococcus casseliflavus TaxID=37734 RepID=UPI002DBFE062|nr:hypothetical protein [Enterococcus casseliflavus]MEB6181093.1 hypothetical protein [Enterococcus casseliflavus]